MLNKGFRQAHRYLACNYSITKTCARCNKNRIVIPTILSDKNCEICIKMSELWTKDATLAYCIGKSRAYRCRIIGVQSLPKAACSPAEGGKNRWLALKK